MALCSGTSFTDTWSHSLLLQRLGQSSNTTPHSRNVDRYVRQGLRLCNQDVMSCSRAVSRSFASRRPQTYQLATSWWSHSCWSSTHSPTPSQPHDFEYSCLCHTPFLLNGNLAHYFCPSRIRTTRLVGVLEMANASSQTWKRRLTVVSKLHIYFHGHTTKRWAVSSTMTASSRVTTLPLPVDTQRLPKQDHRHCRRIHYGWPDEDRLSAERDHVAKWFARCMGQLWIQSRSQREFCSRITLYSSGLTLRRTIIALLPLPMEMQTSMADISG